MDGESENEGKRKQAAGDNLEVVHGSLFCITFTRKTLSLHLRDRSQCGLHIFDAVGVSVEGGEYLFADDPDGTFIPFVEGTDILQES